jgi:excisionase family DNA binding protein
MKLTFDDIPKAVEMLIQETVSLKEMVAELKNQCANKPDDSPLDIEEAAGFLNLAIPTVYSLVHRRQLSFMKRAKKLYFYKKDLLDYLNAGRVKTQSEIEMDAFECLKTKK